MTSLHLFIYRNLRFITIFIFGIFTIISFGVNSYIDPIYAMEGTNNTEIVRLTETGEYQLVPNLPQTVDFLNLNLENTIQNYLNLNKYSCNTLLDYIMTKHSNTIPKNQEIYFRITLENIRTLSHTKYEIGFDSVNVQIAYKPLTK